MSAGVYGLTQTFLANTLTAAGLWDMLAGVFAFESQTFRTGMSISYDGINRKAEVLPLGSLGAGNGFYLGVNGSNLELKVFDLSQDYLSPYNYAGGEQTYTHAVANNAVDVTYWSACSLGGVFAPTRDWNWWMLGGTGSGSLDKFLGIFGMTPARGFEYSDAYSVENNWDIPRYAICNNNLSEFKAYGARRYNSLTFDKNIDGVLVSAYGGGFSVGNKLGVRRDTYSGTTGAFGGAQNAPVTPIITHSNVVRVPYEPLDALYFTTDGRTNATRAMDGFGYFVPGLTNYPGLCLVAPTQGTLLDF